MNRRKLYLIGALVMAVYLFVPGAVPASAQTSILSLDTTRIAPGQCATLTWVIPSPAKSFNPVNFSISVQNFKSNTSYRGTARVCPQRTTTYTLSVTMLQGPNRQDSATLVVSAPSAPPSSSCAEPGNLGGQQQGTFCFDQKPTSPQQPPRPAPPVPQPALVPVRIDFSVDQDTILQGMCTNLRWNVDGVRAVYVEGQGVVGSGSQEVCPPTTTTFWLRAVTSSGDVNRSVTVNVATMSTQPALDLASLSIDKTQVRLGDAYNVCYSLLMPAYIEIAVVYADGSSRLAASGNDDGTGGCIAGKAAPPLGVRTLRLTALFNNQAMSIDEASVDVVPAPLQRLNVPVNGVGEGVDYSVSSMRHTGPDTYAIDYVWESYQGVDVYPALPGQVVFAGYVSDYGCSVAIKHVWDTNYYSIYTHLQESDDGTHTCLDLPSWTSGTPPIVDGTAPIGHMGKSGGGSNDIIHLHFAVRSSDRELDGLGALYGTGQSAFNARPLLR